MESKSNYLLAWLELKTFNPIILQKENLSYLEGKAKWTGQSKDIIRDAFFYPMFLVLGIPFCFLLIAALLGLNNRATISGLILSFVVVMTAFYLSIFVRLKRSLKISRSGVLIAAKLIECANPKLGTDTQDTYIYDIAYWFNSPLGIEIMGKTTSAFHEQEVPPRGSVLVVLYLDQKNFFIL